MEQGEHQAAPSAAGTSAAPSRLLGAFTQEDVARAAGGTDATRRWRTAEWHAQKDTIVALSFRHAEFGTRPEALEPRLVLVQNRAGKLLPVAEGKLDLSGAACRNDAGEPAGGEDQAPDLALDLAAYDLSAGQRAIGVRFTCTNTFPAGEGSETRLLLSEWHGGALRQVFDATIGRTNFDRPSGNQSTTTGVLSVQREQHAGYFDLLLRSKTETEGSDPGAAHKAAGQSNRIERFVWNGERYVASSAP